VVHGERRLVTRVRVGCPVTDNEIGRQRTVVPEEDAMTVSQDGAPDETASPSVAQEVVRGDGLGGDSRGGMSRAEEPGEDAPDPNEDPDAESTADAGPDVDAPDLTIRVADD
jgi:hypothetical protein